MYVVPVVPNHHLSNQHKLLLFTKDGGLRKVLMVFMAAAEGVFVVEKLVV